jgi:hypothetical protein
MPDESRGVADGGRRVGPQHRSPVESGEASPRSGVMSLVVGTSDRDFAQAPFTPAPQ